MARITSYSKKVIAIFLAFALIYAPTLANAANLNGWQVGVSGYIGGGKVGLEAVKDVMLNGQKHTKRSSSSLSVPAARIAKVLAGGGAAVALAEAVTALIGAGIDWVLDPANNQITYKKSAESCAVMSECSPVYQYYWHRPPMVHTMYSSPEPVCQQVASSQNQTLIRIEKTYENGVLAYAMCHTQTANGVPDRWSAIRVKSTVYDPAAEKEEDQPKTIPLEAVAQEVISQADSGSAAAARAVEAAAEDILNEASKDDAKARPITNPLESNASTTTTQTGTGTATKPNTANPDAPADVTDIALEFPVFCGWAPILCEAAQVTISFPLVIADYWATTKDWARSVADEYASNPNTSSDTQLEIPDSSDSSEIDTNISFAAACPAPLSTQINFMGLNKTLEFSFQHFCDVAAFIKPVVISLGAFSAALIVAGVRNED